MRQEVQQKADRNNIQAVQLTLILRLSLNHNSSYSIHSTIQSFQELEKAFVSTKERFFHYFHFIHFYCSQKDFGIPSLEAAKTRFQDSEFLTQQIL